MLAIYWLFEGETEIADVEFHISGKQMTSPSRRNKRKTKNKQNNK